MPLFSSVTVIVMENTSWATLDASTNTPYIHSLKMTGGYATDYHGVAHPSLPNYLAMVSGDTQGVICDCNAAPGSACGSFCALELPGSCACPTTGTSLATSLDAAQITWRGYEENMGTPCNMVDATPYAQRHMPFLYFPDVTTTASYCNDHVVDYTNFAADLASGARRFSFVAPNLTDDMHDPSFGAGPQNLANGDTWLAAQLPNILTSSGFSDGALLVVVWDEDDGSGGLTNTDDPIGMFVLSPYARGGYVGMSHADHYALLATIEDGLNLGRLGNAASATPLADYFAP